MLNKKESLLMEQIYHIASKKNGNCLIKPIDLLTSIPYNVEFKIEELDDTLQALVFDEYIDMVETDKKGEPFYCITLLKKGKAFKREIINKKRQAYYSLALKIGITVVATIVAIVLKSLFS